MAVTAQRPTNHPGPRLPQAQAQGAQLESVSKNKKTQKMQKTQKKSENYKPPPQKRRDHVLRQLW